MNRTIRTLLVLICGLWLGALWASAQTPTTPFRFVAWGDSRSAHHGVDTPVLSSLSNQANVLLPAFTLFTGDLCTSWDHTCMSLGPKGWMYAINNGAPGDGMFNVTFVTRGNHDTDHGLSSWQGFFNMEGVAYLTGATNFVAQTEDATYSFDYANSHFVSVDVPGDVSIITAAELSWLDADLSSAEARGVTHSFIFWHGPIYYVDDHPSTPPPGLITVLSGHSSIAATFHGHEHVMAYTHLDSSRISGLVHPFEQFVSGGAGAPLYTCAVGRSDYCNAAFGFMTVDASDSDFTVSLFLEGGGSTPAQTWTFPW